MEPPSFETDANWSAILESLAKLEAGLRNVGARLAEMHAELHALGQSFEAADDAGNFSGPSPVLRAKGRPEPRVRSA